MAIVTVVRPEVRRSKLLELVESLPPCLIGMKRVPRPTTGRASSISTVTKFV